MEFHRILPHGRIFREESFHEGRCAFLPERFETLDCHLLRLNPKQTHPAGGGFFWDAEKSLRKAVRVF